MDFFKILRDKIFGMKRGEQLYRRGQYIAANPAVQLLLETAGFPATFQGAVDMLAARAGSTNPLATSAVQLLQAYILLHGPTGGASSAGGMGGGA